MLNYKKPAFWIIIVAVAALAITAVCLLTNPKDNNDTHENENNESNVTATTEDGNESNINATIPSGTGPGEIKIASIVDKAESGEVATDSAIEVFYEDDTYTYSFPSIRSDYVIVTFTDGTEKTVKEALEAGEITIADLDAYDIGYIKEENELNITATIPSGIGHSEKKIVLIIDKAESGDVLTNSALEVFYKDDTYTYSFPSIRSDYVIVTFTDGTEKTVKEALEAGEITIADLDAYDIGYSKKLIPAPSDPFHNIIDIASFDIDKDGKAEDCYLGYGPTSGLLTYKIYVSENGTGEYFDIFNSATFLEKFIESNGEWKVQGIDTGENPKTHLFDIFIRDNNVVLSEDGKEMEYWGEFDIDSDAVDWEWPEIEIENPNTDPPVIISTDIERIEPYMHFAYSGEWNGTGFLFAYGTDLVDELPELAKEGSIPTITRSAGSQLDITLTPDRTFQCFYIFDEKFGHMELFYEPDTLSNLESGEYYVGIMFDKKGEYIEQVDMQEYWVWIGVFNLIVE